MFIINEIEPGPFPYPKIFSFIYFFLFFYSFYFFVFHFFCKYTQYCSINRHYSNVITSTYVYISLHLSIALKCSNIAMQAGLGFTFMTLGSNRLNIARSSNLRTLLRGTYAKLTSIPPGLFG